MAHGRNKYQSRENRARVREILLRDWDPIGVSGIPEAADEYDTYANKPYVMLMDEGATASEIAGYSILSLPSIWDSPTTDAWRRRVNKSLNY